MWITVRAKNDVHAGDVGSWMESLGKPIRVFQSVCNFVGLQAEESEIVRVTEVGEVLNGTIDYECTVWTEKVSLKGCESY